MTRGRLPEAGSFPSTEHEHQLRSHACSMICCMPGRMSKSAGARQPCADQSRQHRSESRGRGHSWLRSDHSSRWTEKENVQQVQFDAVNAENTLGRQKNGRDRRLDFMLNLILNSL